MWDLVPWVLRRDTCFHHFSLCVEKSSGSQSELAAVRGTVICNLQHTYNILRQTDLHCVVQYTGLRDVESPHC